MCAATGRGSATAEVEAGVAVEDQLVRKLEPADPRAVRRRSRVGANDGLARRLHTVPPPRDLVDAGRALATKVGSDASASQARPGGGDKDAVVDAHGVFKGTLGRTEFDATERSRELRAPSPPFALMELRDLVPEDRRDEYCARFQDDPF